LLDQLSVLILVAMSVGSGVIAAGLIVGATVYLVLAVWTVTAGDVPVRRIRARVMWPYPWAAGAALFAVAQVWLALESVRHDLVGPIAVWWLGPELLLVGFGLMTCSGAPLAPHRR